MTKRKKRYTGQFWNKVGDHIWAYLERDWRDSKTATKMAVALAQAAGDIDCTAWVVLCVPYENEKNFTTFLKRRIKECDTSSGYLFIRVKATESDEDHSIDSWYFMFGLEFNAIAAKANRYSSQPPALIARDNIKVMIRTLLDADKHPELPGHKLNRWSASQLTRQLLTMNRARHLVELARVEGLSRPFEEELAAFIVHDRPLMFVLEKEDKLRVLRDTGMVSEEELTRIAENIKIEWNRVDMYAGPPSAGAKLDEASGEFNVRKTDSYFFSDRKRKLTEREMGWETINRPDDLDDDTSDDDDSVS